MDRPPSAQGIHAEHARRLRLRAATRRLVVFLLEEGDDAAVDTGRHGFLTAAIATRPPLAAALAHRDRAALRTHWRELLDDVCGDPAFLRGLALLNFEQALTTTIPEHAERAWALATGLWACLACSTRPPVASVASQGDAASRAIDRILELHRQLGSRHLAANRVTRAAAHARCLSRCVQGEAAVCESLSGYGLDVALPADATRWARMAEQAEQRLESWSRAVVEDAEGAATSAEALKGCAPGMRRDYAAALARLEPFIDLGVASRRALVAALELHVDRCYDLECLRRYSEVRTLLTNAQPLADGLAALCTPGEGAALGNQALARYFVYRAAYERATGSSLEECREALTWNPDNSNARRRLLVELKKMVPSVRASRDVVEALADAKRILAQTAAQDRSDDAVRQILRTVRRLFELLSGEGDT